MYLPFPWAALPSAYGGMLGGLIAVEFPGSPGALCLLFVSPGRGETSSSGPPMRDGPVFGGEQGVAGDFLPLFLLSSSETAAQRLSFDRLGLLSVRQEFAKCPPAPGL